MGAAISNLFSSSNNVEEIQLLKAQVRDLQEANALLTKPKIVVPGQMQHHQLLISQLLEHAERNHPEVEIVSRRVEGDIHHCTYLDLSHRAKQLANALLSLPGIEVGDRVATLAWNGYRHLECYFATSGIQRVLHTLNPRLPPAEFCYIVNHAQDKVLFFDLTFLPLIQAIHSKCPTIRYFVLLCGEDSFPKDGGVPNLICYETLLSKQSKELVWPEFDETSAAALCYTSGTTGNPKGVLYSHRSTVLHSFAGALPDALNIGATDCILAVVPMFHVNAWGLPYISAMTGAKLVFPGPAMDGKSVYTLIESEHVNFAAGVPTIWQMLLAHLAKENVRFSTLKRTVVGGSACPPAMLKTFKDVYDVDVIHAWGMTETSPLGSICVLKHAQLARLSKDEQFSVLLKQGRAPFGVEMRVQDRDTGTSLAWDGKQSGDLLIKGHWVISRYFNAEQSALDAHGFFPTGDVATVDEYGFMQITDRSKDVVKSGGEWISSIELENVAMAHPAVAMAACIGVKHPKWDERPIVVVVKKSEVTKEDILGFFQNKVAKWQIPDDVVFVDAIPLGATGKMQKTKLREMLKDYVLPGL